MEFRFYLITIRINTNLRGTIMATVHHGRYIKDTNKQTHMSLTVGEVPMVDQAIRSWNKLNDTKPLEYVRPNWKLVEDIQEVVAVFEFFYSDRRMIKLTIKREFTGRYINIIGTRYFVTVLVQYFDAGSVKKKFEVKRYSDDSVNPAPLKSALIDRYFYIVDMLNRTTLNTDPSL